MDKYNLTVAIDISVGKAIHRVQMTFEVTSKDLDDFGDERELAIFRAFDTINKEFPGARPYAKTMEFYLRAVA